jgi:hypothetical protein
MSFSQYVNNVDNIYRKYSAGSARKEYDNSFKAMGQIEKTIESIEAEISEDSSLDAKQEAVIAILEIGDRVVEGGDQLGSTIRNNFDYYTLGGTIGEIVDTFTPEELEEVRTDGKLAAELRSSQEHAREYALDLQVGSTIEKITLKKTAGTQGSSYATPIDVDLL